MVCGFTLDRKFPDVVSINTSVGFIFKTNKYTFVKMDLGC